MKVKGISIVCVMMVFCFSCNSDESLTDENNDEASFNIEGQWYISGRSGYYQFEGDSVSYKYGENVLGYEEHTIKLIRGEKNMYSISSMMKYLCQDISESEEDFANRVDFGLYSADELVLCRFESPDWIVKGNDIYIPGRYISDLVPKKEYLVSKIVKKSRHQFTIASICPTLYDYIDEPFEYKYYITFTRIK